VLVLDGEKLRATPLPEPKARLAKDDRGGRGERGDRRPPRSREGMQTYRLAVGRNERVNPGGIVGAIANEGGLSSAQIGHIDIRSNHTLVDLPDDLSPAVLERLSHTKVQGKRIELRPDTGRPGRPFKKNMGDRRPGDSRSFRGGDRDRRDGGRGFGGKRDSGGWNKGRKNDKW